MSKIRQRASAAFDLLVDGVRWLFLISFLVLCAFLLVSAAARALHA